MTSIESHHSLGNSHRFDVLKPDTFGLNSVHYIDASETNSVERAPEPPQDKELQEPLTARSVIYHITQSAIKAKEFWQNSPRIRTFTIYSAFLVYEFGGAGLFYAIEMYSTPFLLDPRQNGSDAKCLGHLGYWACVFHTISASSTFGFGQVKVCSLPSRILTIFYCLIGIPFTLYLIADVGSQTCNAVALIYAFISRISSRTNLGPKIRTKFGKLFRFRKRDDKFFRCRPGYNHRHSYGENRLSPSTVRLHSLEEWSAAGTDYLDTGRPPQPTDGRKYSCKLQNGGPDVDLDLAKALPVFDPEKAILASHRSIDSDGKDSNNNDKELVLAISQLSEIGSEKSLQEGQRDPFNDQLDDEGEDSLDVPLWLCIFLILALLGFVTLHICHTESNVPYGWAIYYAVNFYVAQEFEIVDYADTVPRYLLLFACLGTLSLTINVILYNMRNLVNRIKNRLPARIRQLRAEAIAAGDPNPVIDPEAVLNDLLNESGGGMFGGKPSIPKSAIAEVKSAAAAVSEQAAMEEKQEQMETQMEKQRETFEAAIAEGKPETTDIGVGGGSVGSGAASATQTDSRPLVNNTTEIDDTLVPKTNTALNTDPGPEMTSKGVGDAMKMLHFGNQADLIDKPPPKPIVSEKACQATPTVMIDGECQATVEMVDNESESRVETRTVRMQFPSSSRLPPK